jgi:hypothetical protein
MYSSKLIAEYVDGYNCMSERPSSTVSRQACTKPVTTQQEVTAVGITLEGDAAALSISLVRHVSDAH